MIVDADSKGLSLIDTFDQIKIDNPQELEDAAKAQEEPVNLSLDAVIATRWTRSEPDVAEKLDARLRLKLPSGRTGLEFLFTIDLENHPYAQYRFNVLNIQYHGMGNYWFQVQLRSPKGRWRTLSDLPVTIMPSG